MQQVGEGFVLEKHGPLTFYTIPSFTISNLVVHGFTTRFGGSSDGNYGALNLGLHVGDDPAKVIENRQRVCQALGIDFNNLVAGNQVHGNEVLVVTEEHLGRGRDSIEQALPNVDALITNQVGIPLSSYYADCVPLFFLDPINKVIGLAHAGWQGTVTAIGAKTVAKMNSVYGSKPEDILAGIGPAIGCCCYVVDQHVIHRLKSTFDYWEKVVKPCGDDHWMLDLWETNRRILLDAGLKAENITLAGVCTSCNSDFLFSHRASGGCTGRMASLIMLKQG
ncbi:peptidoglycan editing factor PgeF [Peptococcaceae bacterium 1198_IL3148]